MTKNLLLVACLFLAFAACKKETAIDPNQKVRSTRSNARELEPEEAKYDDMIETAANGLLELRNNPMFKTIVHEQVALRFDEDENVLLKTLDSVCMSNGISLQDSMQVALVHAGRPDLVDFVGGAINGFEYFGDTIYLQVYIPNFTTVPLTGTPIVTENHTTEENGSYKGFDQLSQVVSVNESFAVTNLLWVISANEVVGNNGKPRMGGGNPNSRTTAVGDNTIELKALKIYDCKEDFPNGKPEMMYVQVRRSTGSCVNTGTRMEYLGKASKIGSLWGTNLDGSAVCWLATIANPFTPGTAYSDKMNCLWYEKDVRKKFDREMEVVPGCGNSKVSFRSEEDIYGIQEIESSWIGSHPVYLYNLYDNSNGLTDLTISQQYQ